MAKIDLTKQARAPQKPGEILKVSETTSSVTGLFEFTTGEFNRSGSFSGSFIGDGSGLTGISSGGTTRSNATISGSFTSLSSSLASRLAVEEAQPNRSNATISGSFASLSSSLAGRLTTEEAESNRSDATISGSHTALSASLSARLATEEAESVRSDQTISGSHAAFSQSNHTRMENLELRLGKGIGGSGFGLVFGITGSMAAISSSQASRTAALKVDSGSFSTRIQTLETTPGGRTNATISGSFQGGGSNRISGSAVSTGSFGSLVLDGVHFTSASLVQSLSFDDTSNALKIEGGGDVDLSSLAGGGGGGSGTSITASDEGVDLSKAVRTFDFTGNAMTATNDGNEVTVNVSALTSSADIASDISGSFTALSASLSARLQVEEAQPNRSNATISGSFTSLSSSLAARLQVEELESGGGAGASAASISGSWQGVIGSGSLNQISGSSVSTGSFGVINVGGGTFTSASLASTGGGGGGSGIFSDAGSSKKTANDLQITGSVAISGSETLTVRRALAGAQTASTAIFTNNITVGYPTSNAWQTNLEGSFFNNFNNDTNVSEILRFVAGVLSSSLDTASPTPNTKTYNTITATYSDGSETSKNSIFNGVLGSTYENARLSINWTGSVSIDMSKTGSYRAVQNYLELKNFLQSSDRGTFLNDTGTNPFHGSYASRIPSSNITTQGTFGTFSHTIAANAGGSSDVNSGTASNFGMGQLQSGGANTIKVRVMTTQSFSDNHDDQTPDASSTFTTRSLVEYEQSSFGTSNGVTLAKINSSQPAVIPAAFQDGDFNVNGALSGRRYTGGATNAANISASGYYAYHDTKAGLQSGSQSDFSFRNGSDSSTRFYIYTGGLPTDITQNEQTVAIVNNAVTRSNFTFTTRSLSGAPYILDVDYTFKSSAEVTKSFDPAYGYATTPIVVSTPTDTFDSVGSTSLTKTSVSVTNAGVQTNDGSTAGVKDRTKSTQRASSAIPHISDIAYTTASLVFNLDSNSDNVVQNRSSQQSTNYSLVFRTTGTNWTGASQLSNSSTINFYDAALFNQPAASQSMAIYSRAQGFDAGSLTGTSEAFSGEDFRIKLNNNVTSFAGDAFTQTHELNNLGSGSLQVKPGFLVDPGGSRGYWYSTGSFNSNNYRYYIRRFQDGSTRTGMSVDVGKTLVNWNSSTDGVAVALILKSGTSAGSNTSISTCRLFDISATVSNLIEAGVSQDNFKNPFASDIDLYGNSGGSLSSTKYTIPIRNADGMFLDSSDNELYVIIRYKNDPSPVTGITLTFS